MDNIIQYNPTRDIKVGKSTKKPIEYFEKKDLLKLIETARSDKSIDIYNYLLIVTSTGLRVEEALALNWSDIKDDYIIINKAQTRGKLKSTKTINGIRKVPFNKKSLLKFNKNLEVFPKQKDAMHLRSQWNRVVKNSGVEKKQLKCLRHTFDTLALKNGVPINILSAVLGHSSPKVTLERYAAVIKDEQSIFDDRLLNLDVRGHIDGHMDTSNNQKAL